jgi:hypothetical protein
VRNKQGGRSRAEKVLEWTWLEEKMAMRTTRRHMIGLSLLVCQYGLVVCQYGKYLKQDCLNL